MTLPSTIAPRAGLPWSRQQCEWLQALGHSLLVLASDQVGAPEVAAGAASPVAGASDQVTPSLYRALMKATGLPANEAELALQSLGVDAAALRSDPAAKRLLWTRLRRLRGGGVS